MNKTCTIERKLNEIAQVLFQHIDNQCTEDYSSMGLYSDKSGIILFLSHYLHNYPNPKFKRTYERYLNNFLKKLTDEPQIVLNYCSGLAGVFATLRMMNDNALIKLDYSNVEEAYITSMRSWIDNCFSNSNFDFFYGAIGATMYFKDHPQYINDDLLWLEKTAIKDANKYKWSSSLGRDKPNGYNIGLAHGMSSIIIYLSQIYQSGVLTELNSKLLEGTISYVLSQEIDHSQYGCYFPSQSIENGEPITKSRLGWCYGDLGIAAALWQAGNATKNDLWINKALEGYRFSTKRKNLSDAMVVDAGLCHGTSSIAMMFSYIYRETSEELFKNVRDYWVDQTLNMSRFPDGLAGYKQFIFDGNKQVIWGNSYSLLEGIAGIGLMLLSLLNFNAEKDLLTSFALY
ncbi:MAG: lanthionine synthetase C family protein [Bacteroidales bacterium]